mmetsp:Transcript_20354/g.54434  ORF Transcript_20354/g.54434 Transcript_20354/m.54434 type:complete len:216 (-) Transcript_20354:267-914(-)
MTEVHLELLHCHLLHTLLDTPSSLYRQILIMMSQNLLLGARPAAPVLSAQIQMLLNLLAGAVRSELRVLLRVQPEAHVHDARDRLMALRALLRVLALGGLGFVPQGGIAHRGPRIRRHQRLVQLWCSGVRRAGERTANLALIVKHGLEGLHTGLVGERGVPIRMLVQTRVLQPHDGDVAPIALDSVAAVCGFRELVCLAQHLPAAVIDFQHSVVV